MKHGTSGCGDLTVVVEVLSPTTERHDRIAKWREYQRIGALRHFVVVEQKERRIEIYTRTEGGWALAIVEPPDDAVVLDALAQRSPSRPSTRAAAAEGAPKRSPDDEFAAALEQDLSDYVTPENLRPARFEFLRKTRQVNLRFSEALLDAVRKRAREQGISYQRYIRQAVERALDDRH